jgi:cytochrome c553
MSRYINHAGTQVITQATTQAKTPRRSRSATLKAAVSAFAVMATAFATSPGYSQELKGNPEAAAKDKVSMCIGCHGIPNYKASFPHVYYVPKIAGQSEKYLSNALHAYKKGERDHPSMKGIAWSLKDQDIADLAAYYASLTTVQSAAK